MSPEEKFAFRQQFSKVFDDIQESVLRTLFDMPRSLLLIFRLVDDRIIGYSRKIPSCHDSVRMIAL